MEFAINLFHQLGFVALITTSLYFILPKFSMILNHMLKLSINAYIYYFIFLLFLGTYILTILKLGEPLILLIPINHKISETIISWIAYFILYLLIKQILSYITDNPKSKNNDILDDPNF